jgi:hypothetical protein
MKGTICHHNRPLSVCAICAPALEAAMKANQPTEDPMKTLTVSFDELVQAGIDSGAPITRGMPWAFTFRGHPVTHENDDLYLIDGDKYRLVRGESIELPELEADETDALVEKVIAGVLKEPVDETAPATDQEAQTLVLMGVTAIGATGQCEDCEKSGPLAHCSACPKHVVTAQVDRSPEPEPNIEMAASDIPAPVEIPAAIDDTDAPAVEDEDDRDVGAKELAAHIETAPANFKLPEDFLPPGTEIVVEQKGHFIFKLPGQPMHNGRGRTIYGAMVNAGLLK